MWRIVLAVLSIISLPTASTVRADQPASRPPNIIWLVAEDMSPNLGCYGDPQAITPNLDRFAAQGVRFTRAFTHAPVCAPSRSGLITGMYPTTLGTHHMRSKLKKPPPPFTTYLRKAGYHVAWPGKTDFNFDPPKDAFDSTATWTNQLPPEPFFAYANLNVTHESQIRVAKEVFAERTARLKPEQRHDPARMTLPPYYPDVPEVRRDVANYYDLVTAMDYQAGVILDLLERSKLAERTIVFFFSDHGWGMSRGKRWVYDSGIHVPLIIRAAGLNPAARNGMIKPGTVREDLVCLLDFAPTVLSLCGVEAPASLQGQVFLGPKAAAPRKHIFAARDRMDETYDRIRCVRSERYKYIRNFHPELPYAQNIQYMDQMPTMQAWRRLKAEGKLAGPQKLFFAATKPKEELYDLVADPHEINNLAGAPAHQAALRELSGVLDKWIAETQDMGSIPETELIKRGLVEDMLKQYDRRKENR